MQNKQKLTSEKMKPVAKQPIKKTEIELVGEIKIDRALRGIKNASNHKQRERAMKAYLMQCRKYRPRTDREDNR